MVIAVRLRHMGCIDENRKMFDSISFATSDARDSYATCSYFLRAPPPPPPPPTTVPRNKWWRHQMEIFSALLGLSAGNSPVVGGFPTQRPVTWSFYAFFDLRLKKWLSTQTRRWWFETPSRQLWHHCNDLHLTCVDAGFYLGHLCSKESRYQ